VWHPGRRWHLLRRHLLRRPDRESRQRCRRGMAVGWMGHVSRLWGFGRRGSAPVVVNLVHIILDLFEHGLLLVCEALEL
jgi:hypothetical protein